MKSQRTLLSYIVTLVIVPAVVSLGVTLLILSLWNRQQEPDVVMLPTASGTSMPVVEDGEDSPAASAGAGGEGADEGEPGEDAPAAEGPCEDLNHVVLGGETLGAIAEQYGIAMEDVILYNQMLDPEFDENFLSIGQQITIPMCGVPTPTPTEPPTQTPVPTRVVPTPNPTSTQPPDGRVAVEIARVLSPGSVASEAVELINRGTSVARLGDWELINQESGVSYTFPPLNLFPQGAVTVYTGDGENTAIDLYWGRSSAVWSPGDTVLLQDDNGGEQHTFEIPD